MVNNSIVKLHSSHSLWPNSGVSGNSFTQNFCSLEKSSKLIATQTGKQNSVLVKLSPWQPGSIAIHNIFCTNSSNRKRNIFRLLFGNALKMENWVFNGKFHEKWEFFSCSSESDSKTLMSSSLLWAIWMNV